MVSIDGSKFFNAFFSLWLLLGISRISFLCLQHAHAHQSYQRSLPESGERTWKKETDLKSNNSLLLGLTFRFPSSSLLQPQPPTNQPRRTPPPPRRSPHPSRPRRRRRGALCPREGHGLYPERRVAGERFLLLVAARPPSGRAGARLPAQIGLARLPAGRILCFFCWELFLLNRRHGRGEVRGRSDADAGRKGNNDYNDSGGNDGGVCDLGRSFDPALRRPGPAYRGHRRALCAARRRADGLSALAVRRGPRRGVARGERGGEGRAAAGAGDGGEAGCAVFLFVFVLLGREHLERRFLFRGWGCCCGSGGSCSGSVESEQRKRRRRRAPWRKRSINLFFSPPSSPRGPLPCPHALGPAPPFGAGARRRDGLGPGGAARLSCRGRRHPGPRGGARRLGRRPRGCREKEQQKRGEQRWRRRRRGQQRERRCLGGGNCSCFCVCSVRDGCVGGDHRRGAADALHSCCCSVLFLLFSSAAVAPPATRRSGRRRTTRTISAAAASAPALPGGARRRLAPLRRRGDGRPRDRLLRRSRGRGGPLSSLGARSSGARAAGPARVGCRYYR